MTRTRQIPGVHWTSFAAHHTLATVPIGTGRAGAAANISIQTRYCTATTADKPFGEMQNHIGLCGFGALSQQEKTRQT